MLLLLRVLLLLVLLLSFIYLFIYLSIYANKEKQLLLTYPLSDDGKLKKKKKNPSNLPSPASSLPVAPLVCRQAAATP